MPLGGAFWNVGPLEQESKRGTGVGSPPRVSDEILGDRPGIDDRIAPLVEGDPLGEELRAKSVRLACDRVDAKPLAHRSPPLPAGSGIGSTPGALQPAHGPRRRCSANSSAKTSSALRAKRTAPSG